MDLIIELNEKRKQMPETIKNLEKWGRQKAQKEADYRKLLQQEILRLRDEGIAVTIISDLCRGKEEIAEAKRKRDISETMHEATLQSLMCLKLEMGILERQIEAERKGI